MTIGIYKLNFEGTNKCYIGQSIDIDKRYISHCTAMRRGLSPSKLQEAYNTYGLPSLEILVTCPIDELDSAEEDAILIFDAIHNGFNTMSKFGHRSELKGDKCGNSRYSNELVTEAFNYLVHTELTHTEIIELTGISRGAIADISAGNTHKWLQEVFPDEYKILLEKKEHRRRESITKARGGAKSLKEYPPIVSPEGGVYQVTLLREFCRQHGLNHGPLGQVLRGKIKHHKGWKLLIE